MTFSKILKAIKWYNPNGLLILSGFLLSFFLFEGLLRISSGISDYLQEKKHSELLKKQGSYRIVCLGESMTSRQYPAYLQKALEKRSKKISFSVIDKGVIGMNSQGILIILENMLKTDRPDLVIVMTGINDGGSVLYLEDIKDHKGFFYEHFYLYRLFRLIINQFFESEKCFENNKKAPFYYNREYFREKIEPKCRKAGTKVPDKSVAGNNKLKIQESLLWKDKIKNALESFKKGDFELAEKLLLKAYEKNPQKAFLARYLGIIYSKNNNLEKIKELLLFSLKNNPSDCQLVNYLFKPIFEVKKGEFIISELENLNRTFPDNNCLKLILWHTYLTNERAGDAARLKKSFDFIKKGDYLNLTSLAEIYISYKNWEEASELAEEAIRQCPEGARGYYLTGSLKLFDGKTKDAEFFLKKAYEIDPSDEVFIKSLVSLYLSLGNKELANFYLNKIEKRMNHGILEMTRDNLLKIYSLLKAKGIKLAIMQYPLRNIKPLKQIFGREGENILFVDNEQSFLNALKTNSYKNLFVDIFGRDFGHCSERGRKLMAENIADTLFRHFNESRAFQ